MMFISKKYVDTRIRSLIAKFSNFMNRVKRLEAKKSNKGHNHSALQDAIDMKEATFSKNSAFNRSFGASSGNVPRGNHTHPSSSPFSSLKTTNGSNNQANFPQAPYPGGDVPDGWNYVGVVKTDQLHNGNPVFIPAYTWSNGLEPIT